MGIGVAALLISSVLGSFIPGKGEIVKAAILGAAAFADPDDAEAIEAWVDRTSASFGPTGQWDASNWAAAARRHLDEVIAAKREQERSEVTDTRGEATEPATPVEPMETPAPEYVPAEPTQEPAPLEAVPTSASPEAVVPQKVAPTSPPQDSSSQMPVEVPDLGPQDSLPTELPSPSPQYTLYDLGPQDSVPTGVPMPSPLPSLLPSPQYTLYDLGPQDSVPTGVPMPSPLD